MRRRRLAWHSLSEKEDYKTGVKSRCDVSGVEDWRMDHRGAANSPPHEVGKGVQKSAHIKIGTKVA